jgi:hypothetical protein
MLKWPTLLSFIAVLAYGTAHTRLHTSAIHMHNSQATWGWRAATPQHQVNDGRHTIVGGTASQTSANIATLPPHVHTPCHCHMSPSQPQWQPGWEQQWQLGDAAEGAGTSVGQTATCPAHPPTLAPSCCFLGHPHTPPRQGTGQLPAHAGQTPYRQQACTPGRAGMSWTAAEVCRTR